MRGLFSRQRATVRMQPHSYVLNGIAYHPASDKVYVTGKRWDQQYEVAERPALHLGVEHVHANCNLGNPSGTQTGMG
jgi:hypothetical protein